MQMHVGSLARASARTRARAVGELGASSPSTIFTSALDGLNLAVSRGDINAR